ncbi:MAG: 23S rRNA (pseudouridine(1915)-N(3))-methyltransferase RlmH [Gemmatimonadaceae bacterium]
MRFTIVAVGRTRDAALAAAVAEYEARAGRYWPLETTEVREGGGGTRPPEEARRREGEQLLLRAGGALLVACDEQGERLTSREFSAAMQRWREDGRDVAFLVGGAHGLAPDVLQRATRRLSLAPWTLPHEMARLVLAEQLYRAGTIVRGEPYHK